MDVATTSDTVPMTATRPPGTAAVKAEYIIASSDPSFDEPDDDAVEGSGNKRDRDDNDGESSNKKPRLSKAEKKAEKKARQGQNKGRKFAKVRDGDGETTTIGAEGEEQAGEGGQDLCFRVASGSPCDFSAGGNNGRGCKFNHDIEAYLKTKPEDLRWMGSVDEAVTAAYSTGLLSSGVDGTKADAEMMDLAEAKGEKTTCPVLQDVGICKAGFKCRYLGAHCVVGEDGKHVLTSTPVSSISESIPPSSKSNPTTHDPRTGTLTSSGGPELNYISAKTQKLLRTKKYVFEKADLFLKELDKANARVEKRAKEEKAERESKLELEGEATVEREEDEKVEGAEERDIPGTSTKEEVNVKMDTNKDIPEVDDTPDVPLRYVEKNRLHWEGKTYLAPLTTVGNLPFRRLCVSYGADITCGEMSLASSLLSGSSPEWSLVRRHPSEKTFGVQVAGGKPSLLVRVSEVLGKELGSLSSNPVLGGAGGDGASGNVEGRKIDFVDVNCGCPIDLVFKSGSGSALLDAPAKLAKSLLGMNKALGPIPVTIKLRMGVKDGKNTAEKIMLRAVTDPVDSLFGLGGEGQGWGVGCMSLHGRTRQQRYTKLADWAYIKQCVEAVREREEEEGVPRTPIFGNGDIYNAYGYHEAMRESGVSGIMLARGALIKPWIFTEIQQMREWDISSRERLEGVRRLAEWGLSHFGSDTSGVNTTRRYLCEALSFQYRYVPIGLLEVPIPTSASMGDPIITEFGGGIGGGSGRGVDTGGYGRMKINERPPRFRGRDELETLLASPSSQTWVKISEMFLGPAPERWKFVPKHKSNSFESQG